MYIYLSGMIYIMLNIINSSCRVYIRKISILIQGRTTDCTCTWDAYYYDTMNRFWVLWLSILYGYWKLSYWILLQNPASGLIVLSGCGTSGRIAFLTAVSSSFLDIEIKKLFCLHCIVECEWAVLVYIHNIFKSKYFRGPSMLSYQNYPGHHVSSISLQEETSRSMSYILLSNDTIW